MSAPKVFSGARAVVRMAGSGANAGQPVGIFSEFSYGVTHDVQPVNTLGRYSAAGLEYTATEPVRCTATGWKVVGHGPHVDGKFPRVQDLLLHEYIQIDVLDRQTGEVVAKIRDVRPDSYSTNIAARQLVQTSHSFIALLCDDESATNSESAGATDLP